ncbi:acetylhydrolase [soil metagenome]
MISSKSSINCLVFGFVSLGLLVSPVLAQGGGQGLMQGTRAEKLAKFQQMIKAKQAASAENANPNIIVSLQDWTDNSRSRTIPIKIYQPKSAGPWPVVIFSHGLGGSREAAGYFGEAMAENGYLSLHLQHPGSDSSVWMGSIMGGRAKVGQSDFRQNIQKDMRQAMTGENLRLRVDDVKFVLNQLERLNSAAGPWHGKLDMTKVGCSGHSFGAGTTMAIAGQTFGAGAQKICLPDPRVKAAIYMSPPVNLAGRDAKALYGSIKIPGLNMTGTADNSPVNNNSAADRLIPYKNINAPDQYQVVFNGGDHMIFGGTQARGIGTRDVAKDAQFHTLINKLSLAFFDAYLKGDAKQKQWLKQSAATYLGRQATFESK